MAEGASRAHIAHPALVVLTVDLTRRVASLEDVFRRVVATRHSLSASGRATSPKAPHQVHDADDHGPHQDYHYHEHHPLTGAPATLSPSSTPAIHHLRYPPC